MERDIPVCLGPQVTSFLIENQITKSEKKYRKTVFEKKVIDLRMIDCFEIDSYTDSIDTDPKTKKIFKYKIISSIYEEFYNEKMDVTIPDINDKINALMYLISSKFGIDIIKCDQFTLIDNKPYSSELIDLVHSDIKEETIELGENILELINLLKDVLTPYLEINKDNIKAMNNLSYIMYLKDRMKTISSNDLSMYSEIKGAMQIIEELDNQYENWVNEIYDKKFGNTLTK